MTDVTSVDINKIMELLPHRYPFLLIDKVADIKGGDSGTGIKNVTINEPFFQGHFPDKPVMPGVLIVEAMAQTAGVISMLAEDSETSPKLVYFMSIEKAKFRAPVTPGDRLFLHLSLIRKRGPVGKFRGEAKVEGKLVAEAEITAMIVNS